MLDGTRVLGFSREPDGFTVTTDSEATPVISSTWLLGTMGRNKSRFAFGKGEAIPARRYIGVKRHVRATLPLNRIELLAFPGGYCGISAVEEEDRFCLCYLAEESANTRNLDEFEADILRKNPVLSRYLSDFDPLTSRVATSGVFFQSRPLHQDGMVFIGDSAGMIPPLAGNGMSMAMHGAVLALEAMHLAKKQNWDPDQMAIYYERSWKQTFSTRLSIGRLFQRIMENNLASRTTIALFSAAPFLFSTSVRLTHGKKIPLPETGQGNKTEV